VTDYKLGIAILIGYVVLAGNRLLRLNPIAPVLNWRAAGWLPVYLVGMGLIVYLSDFGPLANPWFPLWWDMVAVAVFSLAIYAWAQRVALPTEEIEHLIASVPEEAPEVCSTAPVQVRSTWRPKTMAASSSARLNDGLRPARKPRGPPAANSHVASSARTVANTVLRATKLRPSRRWAVITGTPGDPGQTRRPTRASSAASWRPAIAAAVRPPLGSIAASSFGIPHSSRPPFSDTSLVTQMRGIVHRSALPAETGRATSSSS
jgi:hypothetical protein